MDKKYFFFDIDGTLIPSGGGGVSGIPASTKEAIRLLNESGHFTAIATGRSYAMSKQFLDHLGFDNMVCDGGYGTVLNKKLQGVMPMDKEKITALIRECDEKGFIWGLQTDISDTRVCPDERFYDLTHDSYLKCRVVPGLDPQKCDIIYKAYVACGYPQEYELKTLNDLTWCRYGPGYIFVEPCFKSVGIRKIIDTIGGSYKDVVVFGDQTNDLSMFDHEWTCIAMGNAVEELKKEADYVTTDCDKDGIYNACRHFGWI